MTVSHSTPVPYAGNAARHAGDAERDSQLSRRIAHLRLTTFLIASACLLWTLSRGATPALVVSAVLLYAVFGVLVAWHARVDERVAWHDALRIVNLRALARRVRDWPALPDGGAPHAIDLTDHPYALDLDLFGRASLFQWLGPGATPRGRTTLAMWVLRAAPRAEVVERQAAVRELAACDDWRLKLEAHGVLAAGARQHEIDRFVEWAEGRDTFGRHSSALRGVVWSILVAIWVLIAAQATGVIATALWPIPLLAGLILSFATAARLQTTFDRAGGGQDALGRYGAIFEHAVAAPSGSARLTELLERLSAEGQPAPACMRRLNRILGFAELRRGAALLHFPVQALTLWDFHVLFALERWRRASGPRIRIWLDALAELDALAQLSSMRRDHPDWVVPEIQPVHDITAEGIGHPLIPDDRRITNDVTVGPPERFSSSPGRTCPARALSCARLASTSSSPRPADVSVRDAWSCPNPTFRRAFGCRTRSNAGSRTSWRRCHASKVSSTPRSTSARIACWSICSTRSCRAPTAWSGASRFAR